MTDRQALLRLADFMVEDIMAMSDEEIIAEMTEQLDEWELPFGFDSVQLILPPPKPHEWIEVGARRWCVSCGSYQAKTNGRWRDQMVGQWPGYNKTDLAAHGEKAPDHG